MGLGDRKRLAEHHRLAGVALAFDDVTQFHAQVADLGAQQERRLHDLARDRELGGGDGVFHANGVGRFELELIEVILLAEPVENGFDLLGAGGVGIARQFAQQGSTGLTELLERIGWEGQNSSFVTGRGCEKCFDSGLRGRVGIFELLEMTDELAELSVRDPSLNSLRAYCEQSGMRTLKDEAFRLVEEKQTSLEEILRIVFVKESIAQLTAKAGA